MIDISVTNKNNQENRSNKADIALKAFKKSFPIAVAYFPLGVVLGLVVENQGYLWILGPVMSLFVTSGALQFLALSFIEQGAGLFQLVASCFFIAIRNALYGPAFFHRYQKFSRLSRWYLIFALLDTTYALLLSKTPVKEEDDEKYCLYLSLFIHSYWVLGTFVGGAFGRVLPQIKGLEFSLAILFMILALEQYLKNKNGWVFIVGLIGWFIMLWLIPQYAFVCTILFSIVVFVIVLMWRQK